MNHFTPVPALLGGVLIGLSAVLLLLTDGRIAGSAGSWLDCSRRGTVRSVGGSPLSPA